MDFPDFSDYSTPSSLDNLSQKSSSPHWQSSCTSSRNAATVKFQVQNWTVLPSQPQDQGSLNSLPVTVRSFSSSTGSVESGASSQITSQTIMNIGCTRKTDPRYVVQGKCSTPPLEDSDDELKG